MPAVPLVDPRRTAPLLRSHGISINESVDIPSWVVDHLTYRKWARSDDFPRRGRFAFLAGQLWINVLGEELFTHNIVKTEFTSVLAVLSKKAKLGSVFSDRALYTNTEAKLSTEPDLVFGSFASVRSKRITFVRGNTDRDVEISGSADMVLEVVSKWSVKKETVQLRSLYWLAGVEEYWLVNARTKEPDFQILKRGPKRYTEIRKQAGGWIKSTAFGRSFRLIAIKDEFNRPEYSLEVQ